MEALLADGPLAAVQQHTVAALASTLELDALAIRELAPDAPPHQEAAPAPSEEGALDHTFRLEIPARGALHWVIEGIRRAPDRIEPPVVEVLEELAPLIGSIWTSARAREQLESRLAIREARIARLTSSDMLGVMISTTDGRILEANDAVLDLLGYSRDELERGELRWDILTPPEWRHTDVEALRQLAAHGVARAWRKEYQLRDGRRVPVMIGSASLGGDPMQTVTFVIDNSAQQRVEQELADVNARLEYRVAKSQAELRALSARFDSLREEHLAELSREIHDVFGQELTVLKVDAAWLTRRLQEPAPDAATLVERLAGMTERLDLLHELARRISGALRPKILDDLGVLPAIESHARALARHTGLPFDLRLPDELAVSPRVATALYRIYQELTTNVIRHASATHIELTISMTDALVELCCADNGIGFDPTMARSSLGLVGIRERTLSLGGAFSIDSHPGCGTKALIVLPRE